MDKLAPNKDPGPDEIPNHVLKRCLSILQHHILTLAQYSMSTGPRWLSTGTTEDTMFILSENLYWAWKNGTVFSAIFKDAAGAFNNIHHERLINCMRWRKFPIEITRSILSFLSNKTICMRFNGISTSPIFTPPGSPFSPILYVLCNSDLLEIPKRRKRLRLGFIDNIFYGSQNKAAKENKRELSRLLTRAEQWRWWHGTQFEKSKYALIHFTQTTSAQVEASEASIIVDGTTI